jgi:hypothetical protein
LIVIVTDTRQLMPPATTMRISVTSAWSTARTIIAQSASGSMVPNAPLQ